MARQCYQKSDAGDMLQKFFAGEHTARCKTPLKEFAVHGRLQATLTYAD